MKLRSLLLVAAMLAAANSGSARAEVLMLAPTDITEWKTVYGQVETRDTIAARARIGGSLVELAVSEGDTVKAGQVIGKVRDEKIDFQIQALDAQLSALEAQLGNADSELQRGQTLVDKGVSTAQRLDQLRTQVDVFRNQIVATKAQRAVVVQQGNEGDVLAPADGRVLKVPVTRGAVIMAGESVATIGSGGYFLRLSIPERHAASLKEGAAIEMSGPNGAVAGKLAKIYPDIESGRVQADVEVDKLDTAFIGARLLVKVPVGQSRVLLVPKAAVVTRHGLDFVTVKDGETDVERAVVVGEPIAKDGKDYLEVLTGLAAGDDVVVP
ncbi:efflux RND transporter periplasmic adaptor subunit [Oryzibacter oryziterrae]|uniref:efflux RND transporter periplasmic adaptor subunit n=1 Tax=Oryzibacter oryziterrae TaxID=2766474 RepID=UPI001F0006C0|nr:efflux RND transporter periplasmic adaptor subunit [Oryzibacter oryziterrae]